MAFITDFFDYLFTTRVEKNILTLIVKSLNHKQVSHFNAQTIREYISLALLQTFDVEDTARNRSTTKSENTRNKMLEKCRRIVFEASRKYMPKHSVSDVADTIALADIVKACVEILTIDYDQLQKETVLHRLSLKEEDLNVLNIALIEEKDVDDKKYIKFLVKIESNFEEYYDEGNRTAIHPNVVGINNHYLGQSLNHALAKSTTVNIHYNFKEYLIYYISNAILQINNHTSLTTVENIILVAAKQCIKKEFEHLAYANHSKTTIETEHLTGKLIKFSSRVCQTELASLRNDFARFMPQKDIFIVSELIDRILIFANFASLLLISDAIDPQLFDAANFYKSFCLCDNDQIKIYLDIISEHFTLSGDYRKTLLTIADRLAEEKELLNVINMQKEKVLRKHAGEKYILLVRNRSVLFL